MATAPARAEREPTCPPEGRTALPATGGGLLRALDHPLAGSLRTGSDLVRVHRQAPPPPPLPAGFPALERLLPGGLPRGELVELVGERSSGRLSAVLALLAALTGRGDSAALVDVGGALDPRLAALAGVDLARLLWVRCATVREGLAAAEITLGGGWPLVVLELGERPLAGGRGLETCWQRLARSVRDRENVLLVASPCRASGAAASFVLHGERSATQWLGQGASPRLLVGARGEWTLEKGRSRVRPGAREPLARVVPEVLSTGFAPPPAGALDTGADPARVAGRPARAPRALAS